MKWRHIKIRFWLTKSREEKMNSSPFKFHISRREQKIIEKFSLNQELKLVKSLGIHFSIDSRLCAQTNQVKIFRILLV